MKIKVLYNDHTRKYRVAYQTGRFIKRWKYAQRIVVSAQIVRVSMGKYVEAVQEIAEFDSIGEAEAFIAHYVAPHSEWYDPRTDAWSVEAEVDIPSKKGYRIPTLEREDDDE